VYGEAMGILAGDGLLNYAFETALKAFEHASGKEVQRVVKALEILAAKAGVFGMIGGQTVDITSEGKDISLETLKLMHSLKTGALISAACKIGCIVAGASEDKIAAAQEYAKNIGLAFQITDDVLDTIGDTAQLGKTVGSDEAKNKTTFVSLMGVDESLKAAYELTEKAKKELEVFGADSEFLCELADYLAKRDK
jgi:geranylgeranyl diphosphate synthase type II